MNTKNYFLLSPLLGGKQKGSDIYIAICKGYHSCILNLELLFWRPPNFKEYIIPTMPKYWKCQRSLNTIHKIQTNIKHSETNAVAQAIMRPIKASYFCFTFGIMTLTARNQ